MQKSFRIKKKVKRVRREVWINNNGIEDVDGCIVFFVAGGEGEKGCVCVRRERLS